MKTKNQNTNKKQTTNSGLLSSPEQLTTKPLPKINFKRRWQNRILDTDTLLAVVKAEAPKLYSVCEVVGKWVWVSMDGKQPPTITRELSEFGFSWNYTRKVWQHAGGTLIAGRASYDPRKRYGSYFASQKTA